MKQISHCAVASSLVGDVLILWLGDILKGHMRAVRVSSVYPLVCFLLSYKWGMLIYFGKL